MKKGEGREQLLFALASETRLEIILALEKQNLKMNELARKLGLTATEAFRQLQRLTEALMIQKLPDGTYATTNYGKLTLQLLQPLDFTFKHRVYFVDHDVWRLPYQFINRIGELTRGTLCMDTIENINRSEHDFSEAEEYVWMMAEKALESFGPMMSEKISKGVRFRLLLSDSLLPNYNPVLGHASYIERRTLTDIPAGLLCTEKRAAVFLRSTDGRMDYAVFASYDQVFANWARDLFLYYWEKGKPCCPT